MRTANPAFWKQTSSTVPIYKADFRILCLVLLGLSFTLAGCGGGGGTAGGPAPIIDFSKKRSAVNPSQVVPLFQDRATEGSVNPGDFDFLEVDSPSMVDDGARPADR